MITHSYPRICRRQPGEISDWPGVPPLLARILSARGVRGPDELALTLGRLPTPEHFSGLGEALALLLQARREQWRICIVGDYDADGATATALMVRGLVALGFERPAFLVPNRFRYGYGLSPAIVELARARVQPDLLITVDNGIASVDGVMAARQAGMRVLVTDHHLPGDQLPAADAILNPRLPGQAFAAVNLAGVGVAFYLLAALESRLGLKKRIVELLDLVALGTVADVVILDSANRILVEQGLRRLRAGRGTPGVRALLRVAGRNPARLVAADLGFAAGPRLNAAGRLDDMSRGIECLLAESDHEARQYAEELDAINRERRHIEQGMREAAMQEVARLHEVDLPPALCLYGEDWHEGVVGILASRVKEAVHRPVIAFAPAREEGLIKGSGRSIAGLHMRDLLDRVATRHPQVLQRFGGHAMAAGMTLALDDLPVFRRAFQRAVADSAAPDLFREVVETDGELEQHNLDLATAELLHHRFPWGQGFPPPRFEGCFEVLDHRTVGEHHLKLTLGLPTTRSVIDGIHFQADPALLGGPLRRIEGVYRLEVNEFRGRRQPQLLFEYLRAI